MTIISVTESKQIISHAINNRLNTLALGMGYLEDKTSQEDRSVIRALKSELHDLQDLIEQLKRHS